MCETWSWKDKECQELVPANTNFRRFALKVWNHPAVKDEQTLYGIV